jgi:predicted nucleic acid-binding Zn ribbon protein
MHWKSTEQQVHFQSNDDLPPPHIRGIVCIDWMPEGQTFNQVYCKEILTTFHKLVRRKTPEM